VEPLSLNGSENEDTNDLTEIGRALSGKYPEPGVVR
jgi:hypothetical protein